MLRRGNRAQQGIVGFNHVLIEAVGELVTKLGIFGAVGKVVQFPWITSVYDRARYDLSLNYAADLQPPPRDEDAGWMRGRLQSSDFFDKFLCRGRLTTPGTATKLTVVPPPPRGPCGYDKGRETP